MSLRDAARRTLVERSPLRRSYVSPFSLLFSLLRTTVLEATRALLIPILSRYPATVTEVRRYQGVVTLVVNGDFRKVLDNAMISGRIFYRKDFTIVDKWT